MVTINNVNGCACEGMILFSLHNMTLLNNMKTRLFENKIHNFYIYFLQCDIFKYLSGSRRSGN